VTSRLAWSIKQSFREYVEALSDGVVVGALDADGRFVFELQEIGDAVLKYRGTVSFRGHGGLLAVDLVDPWIHLGNELALSVAEPSGRFPLVQLPGLEAGPDGKGRVERPSLTFEGSYVFDGSYPVGTGLDPLDFSS
jgi:hypothetical protein